MSEQISYRLLIVEDSADDVLLMVAELERSGFHIKYDCVETLESFERTLSNMDYNAILCDHRMPGISSVNILKALKQSGKATPLIVISGVIGEEIGNELLKLGAKTFVFKDDLKKLPEVLMRTVSSAQRLQY